MIAPEEMPVFDALSALGIESTRYEHPAVASAVAAEEHWSGIDAAHCKNLFLRTAN